MMSEETTKTGMDVMSALARLTGKQYEPMSLALFQDALDKWHAAQHQQAGSGEAGKCTRCGKTVFHREGYPGEFDHEPTPTSPVATGGPERLALMLHPMSETPERWGVRVFYGSGDDYASEVVGKADFNRQRNIIAGWCYVDARPVTLPHDLHAALRERVLKLRYDVANDVDCGESHNLSWVLGRLNAALAEGGE
jgi:hypothetical protein